MHVIDTLLPVFLFVVVGLVLRTTSFLPVDFFKGCNKLVFYLGLPAFLFSKIITTNFNIEASSRIFYILIITMLLSIVIAYITAYLMGIPKQSYSAFIQVAFRGNTALVGLPILVYAFNLSSNSNMINIAIVALAPAIPIWNIATLILLTVHKKEQEKHFLLKTISSLISNPLVVACIAGLIFSFFNVAIPRCIEICCTKLGQMTMPLALISIGASLSLTKLQGKKSTAFISAIIKVCICPLIALVCGYMLNLNQQEMFTSLIYCATPTAISAYVMTEQMGGDEQIAGSGIVLSTLISAIPLTIIVAIWG